MQKELPPIIRWELVQSKGKIARVIDPLNQLDQKCAEAKNKPDSLNLLGSSPQHKVFLVYEGYHPYGLDIPNKEKRTLIGPDGSTIIVNSYPDFFRAGTADRALVNSLEDAGFSSRICFAGGYNTAPDTNLPQERCIYHCTNRSIFGDTFYGTALRQRERYGYHGGLYDVRDCNPNSIDYITACLSYRAVQI